MMEVTQLDDGRFAVRDVGGTSLGEVMGVFDTEKEADEWMLNSAMIQDADEDGLDILKPGTGQGL